MGERSRGRAPGDPLPGRRVAGRRGRRGRTRGHRGRDRAAARAPSTTGAWPGSSALERGALLHRVADLLERDKAAVARAESLDTGKRLVESEYDVDDVVGVFRHYGNVAAEDAGRVVDTGRADVVSRIVHEPIGVCGLITPWNYPLLQTAWKVAPCLAAGNTFVLKPSELTPHTAILLMGLLEEAGVPAGVGQPGARRRPARGRPAQRGPPRRPGVVHRRPGRPASGSWPRPRRP